MNDQKLINKSYLNTPKGAYKIDINPIYTWVQGFECSSYAYILSTFRCKAQVTETQNREQQLSVL